MIEVWKSVNQNYDYEVSNLGNIRSLKSGKPVVLKVFPNKRFGYLRINLMDKGKLKQVNVHRLVAEAFIGDVSSKVINHINGIKTDNRVENLEIVTQKENILHSINVLGNLLRPVIQIDLKTGEHLREFHSITAASIATETPYTSIGRCCKGTRNKAGGFKWEFKY